MSFTYPPARQDDVVDDYHGTAVRDPYRWLEDPDAPDTVEWVSAQNAITFQFIRGAADGSPQEEAGRLWQQLKERLTRLWDYPKYGVPRREGRHYFFWKNDGLQNQHVLCAQQALDGEAVPVLDNSGFYYNRFPEPGSVPPEDQSNFQRVYLHRLGTSQAEDALVYERPEAKELGFTPFATDDGAYLILHVWRGTEPRNRIAYRPLLETTDAGALAPDERGMVRLLDEADAKYDFVDNVGPLFYFLTDLDAPNGRVVAIDVRRPARAQWREVIPEGPQAIDRVVMANNQLVVVRLRDAHDEIGLYSLEGEHLHDLPLPAAGTVASLTPQGSGLHGRRTDSELFLGFTSYLYPLTPFRYDLAARRLDRLRAPQIDFDATRYVTRQVFYTSRDGTRVPMFLTHRRDLALDGSNPTLLYGYGGFNISLTPGFNTSRLVWLEQGGVYAVANLRGGAEYGRAWHEGGILDKKQNVFDDFIAAAEWLCREGYTSRQRLVIQGGSNGGLLVAACLTQRPELFGAALCQVPVADMLRYHRFTVGRYWTTDYGNAEASAEHFRFLYAYSPLHNVRPGTAYPPTLITSADTDDRVVPAHAKKLAATLQAAQAGPHPVLIRVETRAGHGAGKPTSKVIEEQADLYAFLFQVLGLAYDRY